MTSVPGQKGISITFSDFGTPQLAKSPYHVQDNAMNLPLEIVRLVIGEATRVPAAFDTSFKASISEHVETVADAIRESMKTKLALCLVSKSFHDMLIEFLYEINTLRQLQYANPLVDLLRRKTKPCKQYCGWWCHRLEITIGEGSNEY